MPGNIQLAAPVGVLPGALCRSYQRAQEYKMLSNWYPDGRHQRMPLVTGPRNSWVLSQRLGPAALAALKNFYVLRQGNTQPFYFYDQIEYPHSYDPSGVNGLGRYTVRFAGNGLAISGGIGRSDAQFSLIEIY